MVGKAHDLSHEQTRDRGPHREIAGVASSSANATTVPQPDNDELANLLERIADLLDTQRGNLYRVRAYRNAARTIRRMKCCGFKDGWEASCRSPFRAGEDAIKNAPDSLCLASIGPETTKTLKKFTDQEIPQADEYTIDGVVELLLAQLRK